MIFRQLLPCLTTGLVLAVTARGDAVPPASLTDSVRDAVAAKKIENSDNLGDRTSRVQFRDVAADGAVLVGLEVGIAKSFGREIPYSLRPIYRRGNREWIGGTAGNFEAKDVKRTVRVAAKDGYAVGGIWVRAGGAMDRLCLVFIAVGERGLIPSDSYTSAWVGTSDGGTDKYIDGHGQPIVGLLADTHQGQVKGMGLVYAKIPPVKKSAPKTEPTPKEANAIDHAAPQREVKLGVVEQKNNLGVPEDDEGGNDLILVVVVLCGAVGIPLGIVGVMAFGKGQRLPPVRPKTASRPKAPIDESERPSAKVSVAETIRQPASARPELARRLQGYKQATVVAPADISAGDEQAPPFFLVRATYRARRDRMTRIYVLPAELLVIDAGPGTTSIRRPAWRPRQQLAAA